MVLVNNYIKGYFFYKLHQFWHLAVYCNCCFSSDFFITVAELPNICNIIKNNKTISNKIVCLTSSNNKTLNAHLLTCKGLSQELLVAASLTITGSSTELITLTFFFMTCEIT